MPDLTYYQILRNGKLRNRGIHVIKWQPVTRKNLFYNTKSKRKYLRKLFTKS